MQRDTFHLDETNSSLEQLGEDIKTKGSKPLDDEYVSVTVRNTVHIPAPLGAIICVIAAVVLFIVAGAACLWCRRRVLESQIPSNQKANLGHRSTTQGAAKNLESKEFLRPSAPE